MEGGGALLSSRLESANGARLVHASPLMRDLKLLRLCQWLLSVILLREELASVIACHKKDKRGCKCVGDNSYVAILFHSN